MKKVLIVLATLLLGIGSVWAQNINIDDVDTADIDFSLIDLSGVEFYFQGPMDLYVTGVRYGGTTYAAVLEYNGGQIVNIRAPNLVSTVGKPMTLDLSEVSVDLGQNGLELGGVIADGRYYSGILQVTPGNDLRVASVLAGSRVEQSNTELVALRRQVGRLETELERRDARIARLNDQIEELPEAERVTRLRNQLQDLEADLQNEQSQIDNLRQTVSQRDSRIGQLETTVERRDDRIDGLEQTVNRRNSEIGALEAANDKLEADIALLETEIENRETRIATLQTRLQDLRVSDWETAGERLDRVVVRGFRGGSVGTGTWEQSSVAVTQTDRSAFFAKYIVPARQGTGELYYRFTGRALGSGRQGYGIHILAGNSSTPRGYGYGESYLVWLTRDEAKYQTSNTYVQLYRSYNDTRMIELTSAAANVSIDDSNIVEVHVNDARSLITVIVDGEAVLTYQADGAIRRGSEVVARTMGSAVIRDLSVRTE